MRFDGFVGAVAGVCWLCAATVAQAETLRATYSIALIGLPIGVAEVNAQIANAHYNVQAQARLAGVASWIKNARAASTGNGEILDGHISPATFATSATGDDMTRTIRMAVAGNAVVGVDISPPFVPRPDRVPLTDKDTHGILDPVGAFVLPAPPGDEPTSPAACNRTLPIFDGYTRFDIALAYIGERKVKTKGYSGPVAICSVRYIPIAGHRRDRPGTKFMADNKDMEVWLAPIAGAHALWPYRVSVRTLIGTVTAEANEFRVDAK
jgi:Protein of unknown function (DUF3108)